MGSFSVVTVSLSPITGSPSIPRAYDLFPEGQPNTLKSMIAYTITNVKGLCYFTFTSKAAGLFGFGENF